MRWVLLLVLVLLLVGCGKQIKSGRVVSKWVVPSYTSTWYAVLYVNKVPIYVPETVYHDTEYDVKIEASVKGKLRTRTFLVTHDRFDTVKVGQELTVQ